MNCMDYVLMIIIAMKVDGALNDTENCVIRRKDCPAAVLCNWCADTRFMCAGNFIIHCVFAH